MPFSGGSQSYILFLLPTSYYNDRTGGIGYYQFLEQLDREYPEHKKEIIARLKQVMARLFTVKNLLGQLYGR